MEGAVSIRRSSCGVDWPVKGRAFCALGEAAGRQSLPSQLGFEPQGLEDRLAV